MKKYLLILPLLALTVGAVLYGSRIAKADIFGSSLVAYYTLDSNDISGTSVYDKSGNGNTGTIVNSPTQVAGILGQALSFNGTSQYVTTSNTMNFAGPVTLSAWIKTTTSYTGTNWAMIVGVAYTGTSNFEIGFGNAGGGIGADNGAFVFGNLPPNPYGVANYGAKALNDGKWHLVVGERDINNYLKISVDGAPFITGTVFSATISNPFDIAAKSASGTFGQFFDSSIDDVRIYNRALSASEVQQLYYQGIGNHGQSNF